MNEVRTEAGRAFADDLFALEPPPDGFAERVAMRRSHHEAIAAIEDEARSSALAQVEDAVKGLDSDCHTDDGWYHQNDPLDQPCSAVDRAAVLAAIADLRTKGGTE